nr:phage-related protein tail component-like protein [uncultured Mediterranean phage uvMED]
MTDKRKLIRGAGGPPPPPKPFRAPDTLHSRQFATVQDLISEGEIEGFSSPSKAGITDKTSTAYNNAALKDVFLNDTPVLNADASNTSPASGDFNFQDVTFKTRFGTANQTKLTGIPTETRRPVAVSTADVTTSAPVIKQLTDSAVDAVIVTLTWAQIQRSDDEGNIHGSTVQYKIFIQYSGGSYIEKVNTSVVGRTADSYSRDHRIDLDGNFPVNVKVERVTADADPAGFLRDEFKFSFIQEVIDNDSTYANSAYTALRLDSKIFNSVPARTFRIRGIKVRIPGAGANSSGTPTVDLQTGRIIYPSGYIFNGTMQAAIWTTCPAFILLDLLITKRYGLGDHIASDQTNDSTTFSNVDLFSFFAASKYANELVDDGTGSGTEEARFSCNVNIQSPKEAFAAINELSGVMRCMPIWSAGTINISQDSPKTASYLFSLANVGEAGFNYQGSSLKQRHSVISVSYFNMDSREVDFEVYEDTTAIAKLGTIVKQVKAFACTSRNQAKRLARAILFAEQNESETVTFTTSIDSGMLVRPGAVIEINDPVRAGARRGGRIVSATTSTITIDAETQTTLPSLTDSPTISVILPDGTVESRSITGISGAVITVGSVFSAVPNTNSPYLISSTTLSTQLFRVIQVTEEDDINYAISALTYVEGKYAFIEDGTPLPERNISLLNEPLGPPSNLTSEEKTIVINGVARSKLIISWKEPTKALSADDGTVYESPQGASSYQLNYRVTTEAGNTDNFITQEVFSNDFELMDTKKGSVEVEIYSYNASGTLSPTALVGTITTIGKSGAPDNVTNLTIEPINEQFIRLRFDQSTSVDVLHGGRVYVRHSNLAAASSTFQTAQDVIEAVAGSSNEVICPALPGTYLLKFQDDTGQFSQTPAKASLSLVDILDSITVKTDREDNDSPPFNNTTSSLFTNTQYSSSKGGLILTNPVNNATGTYDFATTLDLGGVFSLTLKRHFQGVGFYTGDLFDNRTDFIDTWTNFDGTEAPDANAKLAVRTSTDMSSYSDFNDFANGTFKGRGFQFRATLNTSDTAQNINLQQLGYSATLPSRTEQSAVIASGAGAKAVTFAAPFFVGTSALGNLNNFLPSVNISPQNMATGDFFELSSISGTGFTVHFKNSSNASINRNFTYSAVGFGKGG